MKTYAKKIVALLLLTPLCSCINDAERFQMSHVTQAEKGSASAYFVDTEEGTVWFLYGPRATLVELPRQEE